MARDPQIRERRVALPSRGPGDVAVLDIGPPERPVEVVFLHANGFNADTYRRVLGPLGARHRLLAFDQRGHGRTTLPAIPDGRTSWLDLRDDLLALLRAEGVAGAVLSGHSMGATAALLAAAENTPARRLVLFEPVMLPAPTTSETRDSPMVQAAARRRADFASRDEAVASYRGRGAFRSWPEAMLRDYVAAGFRDTALGVTLACTPRWEASNYAAHGHDAWGALARIRAPIDIFVAETGSTFSRPASGLDLGALAPRAVVRVVAGATHFLPMERPDVVQHALASALDGGAPA